jgi:PKD repeat protein
MRLLSILPAAVIVLAILQGCVALADPGTLSAVMEVSETHGPAPFTAGFEDNSTGNVTGWQWNFGDGTANVTERGTMHTFPSPGTYLVILTVTDGIQNHSTSTQITVDPSLFAGFASNTINESSLLDVQFYDTSVGDPDGWQWNFGDGTANATDSNPSHTFPAPGTYNVTLTVAIGMQSNSTSQQIEVLAGPAPTLNARPPTATPAPSLPAGVVVLTLIATAGLAAIARRSKKK